MEDTNQNNFCHFKDPEKFKQANSKEGQLHWETAKQNIIQNGGHIRSISSWQRTGINGKWDLMMTKILESVDYILDNINLF